MVYVCSVFGMCGIYVKDIVCGYVWCVFAAQMCVRVDMSHELENFQGRKKDKAASHLGRQERSGGGSGVQPLSWLGEKVGPTQQC